MKKSRKKMSKKKKSIDIISILLIVIILTISIWFISRYVINQIKGDNGEVIKSASGIETELPAKEEGKDDVIPQEKNNYAISLNGCWMSTTEGAVLSISGDTYRLDFMGVDSNQPLIGTFTIKGNIITLINKEGACKGEKGEYEIVIDKNDVSFKCKNDPCTKRKSTLTTEWEWLEE
ncbi:MAG: hypothetical protein ACI358_00485 [Candidatus Limimorpha sp.]